MPNPPLSRSERIVNRGVTVVLSVGEKHTTLRKDLPNMKPRVSLPSRKRGPTALLSLVLLAPMALGAGCANAPGQQDLVEIHDLTNSCVQLVIGGTSPQGGSATASPPINVSGLPTGGLPFAALSPSAQMPAASDSQTCTVAPAPPATPSPGLVLGRHDPGSAGPPSAAEPVRTAAVRRGKPVPAPTPPRIIAVPARLGDSPFYFVRGPLGPLVHYREPSP
jgi:hypothetical protein